MTITLWIPVLFEKNFHIRFNFFFMHVIVYCIYKNKSTDLNNRYKNLIIYIYMMNTIKMISSYYNILQKQKNK